MTALHLASKNGHARIADLLLKAGVDKDKLDDYHRQGRANQVQSCKSEPFKHEYVPKCKRDWHSNSGCLNTNFV